MTKKFMNVELAAVEDIVKMDYPQYVKKGLMHNVLVQLTFAVHQLKAGVWDNNLVGWRKSVEDRIAPFFDAFVSQCVTDIIDYVISCMR